MNPNILKQVRKSDVWQVKYKNVLIKIHNWNYESGDRPDGIWNYYIFICESTADAEQFAAHWLTPERTKFTPQSPEHLTYDYFQMPAAQLDWHGGVTYYCPHGQLDGHRIIEIGCDYNHYMDEHRQYTMHDVLRDAIQTADQIVELFKIKLPGQ